LGDPDEVRHEPKVAPGGSGEILAAAQELLRETQALRRVSS